MNVIIALASPVQIIITTQVVRTEPEIGEIILGANGATVSIVIVTPEIAQVLPATSVTNHVIVRTPSANIRDLVQ